MLAKVCRFGSYFSFIIFSMNGMENHKASIHYQHLMRAKKECLSVLEQPNLSIENVIADNNDLFSYKTKLFDHKQQPNIKKSCSKNSLEWYGQEDEIITIMSPLQLLENFFSIDWHTHTEPIVDWDCEQSMMYNNELICILQSYNTLKIINLTQNKTIVEYSIQNPDERIGYIHIGKNGCCAVIETYTISGKVGSTYLVTSQKTRAISGNANTLVLPTPDDNLDLLVFKDNDIHVYTTEQFFTVSFDQPITIAAVHSKETPSVIVKAGSTAYLCSKKNSYAPKTLPLDVACDILCGTKSKHQHPPSNAHFLPPNTQLERDVLISPDGTLALYIRKKIDYSPRALCVQEVTTRKKIYDAILDDGLPLTKFSGWRTHNWFCWAYEETSSKKLIQFINPTKSKQYQIPYKSVLWDDPKKGCIALLSTDNKEILCCPTLDDTMPIKTLKDTRCWRFNRSDQYVFAVALYKNCLKLVDKNFKTIVRLTEYGEEDAPDSFKEVLFDPSGKLMKIITEKKLLYYILPARK